jgi:cardiolipin synthase
MRIDAREFLLTSNLVTLSRVIMIIPILLLVRVDTPSATAWLFVVMVLAGISDILDGYVARKLNQTTELGQILDPLADKIVMAALFLGMVYYRGFPLALLVLLAYRDLIIVGLGAVIIRSTNAIVVANAWGKANTFIFGITGLAFLVSAESIFYRALAILAYAMILASGASYLSVAEKALCNTTGQRWALRIPLILVTGLVIYGALQLKTL